MHKIGHMLVLTSDLNKIQLTQTKDNLVRIILGMEIVKC